MHARMQMLYANWIFCGEGFLKSKLFPSPCHSNLLLILLLRIMQNEIPRRTTFICLPSISTKKKNSYRRHQKRDLKKIYRKWSGQLGNQPPREIWRVEFQRIPLLLPSPDLSRRFNPSSFPLFVCLITGKIISSYGKLFLSRLAKTFVFWQPPLCNQTGRKAGRFPQTEVRKSLAQRRD